jgi:hypothetical protein
MLALGLLFFISAWLTGTLLSLYITYRFGELVRNHYASSEASSSRGSRAYVACRSALPNLAEEIILLLHLHTSSSSRKEMGLRGENDVDNRGRTGFPEETKKEDVDVFLVDGFSMNSTGERNPAEGSEASEPVIVERSS